MRFILSVASMLILTAGPFAPAAQSYSLQPIGLLDTDPTPHGTYYVYENAPVAINQAGEVAGTASSGLYQNNTWVYLPLTHTTQQIGLEDAAHTVGGYSDNSVQNITPTGLVVGFAGRFDTGIGNELTGRDAWSYSPANNTTRMIGLTDPGHVSADGRTNSQAQSVNANDQILGFSGRFTGNTSTGEDVWIYSPAAQTTTAIGLIDAAHTRNDGYSLNTASAQNDAGQVVGYANHYAGSTLIGTDAWLYNSTNQTTTQIGLLDAAHTQTGGTSSNQANGINNAGDIIGVAEKYNGSIDRGQDAWVYSASTHTTQVIGLTDAAHTDSSGNTFNTAEFIADNGQVCGMSDPGNGAADTWVYSSVTHATNVIGLARTGPSYHGNQIELTNHAGEIVGSIDRGNGPTLDTWVYTPADQITRKIGLLDSAHTTASGYAHNQPTFINATGVVAGFADEVNPSGVGFTGDQDAWIYNPLNQTTYALIGSVNTDGNSDSYIEYLSDDGSAVGYYYRFTGNGDYTQDAFRCTQSGGLQDLGALVTNDLTALGWASLVDASVENTAGQIAGQPDAPDGLAYLLTPTSVPEPASMLVIISVASIVSTRGNSPGRKIKTSISYRRRF